MRKPTNKALVNYHKNYPKSKERIIEVMRILDDKVWMDRYDISINHPKLSFESVKTCLGLLRYAGAIECIRTKDGVFYRIVNPDINAIKKLIL